MAFVDVDHGVELRGQPRAKIVARALGVGTVDHADGALESWPGERGRDRLPHRKQKRWDAQPVKMRLPRSLERRPHALALDRGTPFARRGDRARIGREADEPNGVAVTLAGQLPHVQLAYLSQFGRPRVADM